MFWMFSVVQEAAPLKLENSGLSIDTNFNVLKQPQKLRISIFKKEEEGHGADKNRVSITRLFQ